MALSLVFGVSFSIPTPEPLPGKAVCGWGVRRVRPAYSVLPGRAGTDHTREEEPMPMPILLILVPRAAFPVLRQLDVRRMVSLGHYILNREQRRALMSRNRAGTLPRPAVEVLTLLACPSCGVLGPSHPPCLCHYRLVPPEDAGLPSLPLVLAVGFAAIGLVSLLAWGVWGVLAWGGR